MGVAESVCAVARRYGLSPQQLFGWRRQLRDSEAERSEADGLQFVPAVVAAGSSPVPQRRAAVQAEASAGTIEVEINGVTDAKTLMAVGPVRTRVIPDDKSTCNQNQDTP
jgi:transposase